MPVVQNCGILKEYCEFMDIVFRYQAELKSNSTKEEMEGCYDKAIKEAISKGILVLSYPQGHGGTKHVFW